MISKHDMIIAHQHATATLWRVRELVQDGKTVEASIDQARKEMNVDHLTPREKSLTYSLVSSIGYEDVGWKTLRKGRIAAWEQYDKDFGPFSWWRKCLYINCGVAPAALYANDR